MNHPLTPQSGHSLAYVEAATRSLDITLDEFGQPVPVIASGLGWEIIDVTDSWLTCSTCGLLGYDELANHGINPDWQSP